MARTEGDDFGGSRPIRRGPAVVEIPPGRSRHSLMMTWARLWTGKLHKRLRAGSPYNPLLGTPDTRRFDDARVCTSLTRSLRVTALVPPRSLAGFDECEREQADVHSFEAIRRELDAVHVQCKD
jgi:hypothetical protein